MKWIVLFILCVQFAAAVDVQRNLPVAATFGETITVSLTISDVRPGGLVLIGELIPEGSLLESWDIDGAIESGSTFSFVQEDNNLIWEFIPSTSQPVLTYTLQLPQNGTASFDSVFATSPNNYGNSRAEIALFPPTPEPESPLVEQPVSVVPLPSPPGVEPPRTHLLITLIALVIITAFIAFGYIAVRTSHSHPHVSFVDECTDLVRKVFRYAKLRLQMELGEFSKSRLPKEQASTLTTFELEREHLIEEIERVERKALAGDDEAAKEAKRLKRELKSTRIRFD